MARDLSFNSAYTTPRLLNTPGAAAASWSTLSRAQGGPTCANCDAPPNDMRLTRPNLAAVLEGRTTVQRPCHLPHAGVPLHPLHPQARTKALTAAGKVGDELRYRLAECPLLLRGEPVPVTPERREDFTRRHHSASPAPPRGHRRPRAHAPATRASRTTPARRRCDRR